MRGCGRMSWVREVAGRGRLDQRRAVKDCSTAKSGAPRVPEICLWFLHRAAASKAGCYRGPRVVPLSTVTHYAAN